MMLELIVTAFIATYIAIVILGHLILFDAIRKCPREGRVGDARRPTKFEGRPAADRKAMPAQTVSVWNGLRI
jgi:hypothetical protein